MSRHTVTEVFEKYMLNNALKSVSLNNEKDFITFEFLDGTDQKFSVEGDCCSNSWIEHLELPNELEGATLLKMFENTIDDFEDEENGGNFIQVYQTHFVTDKGDIVLEYRNSSNGYYGGHLVAV